MWKPPAMEQVVALQAGWTPWSLQQERMAKRAPRTLQPKAEDGWNEPFNPPVKTDNGWRSSPEPPVGTEAEPAATESSGRHEVEPAGAEYSGRDKTEPADTESSGRDEADGWNGSPEPPAETRNGWSDSPELPAQKKNGWSSSPEPPVDETLRGMGAAECWNCSPEPPAGADAGQKVRRPLAETKPGLPASVGS